MGWVLGRVLYMNNNTNPIQTPTLEVVTSNDFDLPMHKTGDKCYTCKEWSDDVLEARNEETDFYMAICNDCYEELVAFEEKFGEILGL